MKHLQSSRKASISECVISTEAENCFRCYEIFVSHSEWALRSPIQEPSHVMDEDYTELDELLFSMTKAANTFQK